MRLSLLVVPLLVALPACDSCANKTGSADAATSASGAAEKKPPRRGRGSHPATAYIDAATTLGLDAATRAKIEHLDDGLEDEDTKTGETYKAYRAELANGVRANTIDPSKLEPYYALMASSAKAREERAAEVFDKLHAALTPEQRKALADKVKADQALRDVKQLHARRQPSGEHRLLLSLTRGLELDGKQQTQVRALVPADGADAGADPKSAHFREVADAFAKTSFDAKEHLFDAKEARGTLEDQTKLVGALMPILTADQRTKLAGLLDGSWSPPPEER